MQTTLNFAIPKPGKGSGEEVGYMKNAAGAEDTPLRIALDLIDARLAAEPVSAIIAASGAIAQKVGIVRLGSTGVLAMTLADPTTGTDDGKKLTIVAVTAHAHVITIPGGLAGGAHNTVTLGGAIGDLAVVRAIAGKWFLAPSIDATASTV